MFSMDKKAIMTLSTLITCLRSVAMGVCFTVLLTTALLGLATKAHAQSPLQVDTATRVVTGKVQDQNALPLAGVEVYYKGRLKSVFTGADGAFSIRGLQTRDSILTFSFPGYVLEEVLITDSTTEANPTLTKMPLTRETGYSTVVQAQDPAAFTQLVGTPLTSTPTTGIDASLQGKVAGLQIQQSTGMAGASVLMAIRGKASILGGSEPLIILDGMPILSGTNGDGGGAIGSSYGFQTSPLAELNMSDIETIDVLKDAAATAQYGNRAGNGVIVIRTKRGIPGRTKFNLNYFAGPSFMNRSVKMADGAQYRQATTDAFRNTFGRAPQGSSYLVGGDSIPGFDGALANNTNTDWLSKTNRPGFVQEGNLSASGGNRKVSFFVNGAFRSEQSPLVGHKYDRASLRFNAENKATENLILGIQNGLSFSNANYMSSGLDTIGGFGMAQLRALPVLPERYTSGNVTRRLGRDLFNPYFSPYNGGNIEATNNADYYNNLRQVFRNISVLYGEYSFGKNFVYRSELGFEYYTNTDRAFRSRYIQLVTKDNPNGGVLIEPTSSATDQRQLVYNLNFSNTLRYQETFGDHKVSATAGYTYLQNINRFNGSGREKFPFDYSQLVSGGAIPIGESVGSETGFSNYGAFVTGQDTYKGKYTFGLTVRADAHSRLTQSERMFPTFAVFGSYLLSGEEFMKEKAPWVSHLLARASFGVLGNTAFGNEDALGFWRGGQGYVYSGYQGRVPYRLAPNLQPEQVMHTNVGFDLGVLENRVMVSADFFVKQSSNLMLLFPLPPTNGLDFPYSLENKGRMTNMGLELTVSADVVKTDKFTWNTAFNATFINNTVNDLGGLRENLQQNPVYGDLGAYVGQSLGSFYLARHAGTDANGREMILDRNGNAFVPTRVGQIDSARVLITDKVTMPRIYGGWTNTFSYGPLDLGIVMSYALGQTVLDNGERLQSYVTGNNNLRADAVSGRTLTYSGTVVDGGQTLTNLDPLSQRNTTKFLQDASWVRVRSITLGYTFSDELAKKLSIERLRIYIQMQNPLLFTPFKGWDPEVYGNATNALGRNLGTGVTSLDYPIISSTVFGLNLAF